MDPNGGTLSAWGALWTQMLLFLPRLASAAALSVVVWSGARLIRRVITGAGERRNLHPDALRLVADGAFFGTVAVGLASALGTLGVNIAAVVGALGLTGFALGFAFRDVLSNLLAGVLVLVYQPFRRGDEIVIGGKKGVVREVNLRYTRLESPEEVYLVPNSALMTEVITVESRPRA